MEYWGTQSKIFIDDIRLTNAYSKVIAEIIYHQKNILLKSDKRQNNFFTFYEIIQSININIEDNFLDFHKKVSILPIDLNDFSNCDTAENLIQKLKCRLIEYAEQKTDLVLLYNFFDFHLNKLPFNKEQTIDEYQALCIYGAYLIAIYQTQCYDFIELDKYFWDVLDEFDVLALFNQIFKQISKHFIVYLDIKNADTSNFIMLSCLVNFVEKTKNSDIKLIIEYSDTPQYIQYIRTKYDFFYLDLANFDSENVITDYQVNFNHNLKHYKNFVFEAETQLTILKLARKHLSYFNLKDIKDIFVHLVKINAIKYNSKENNWEIRETYTQKIVDSFEEYYENKVEELLNRTKNTELKLFEPLKKFLNISYFLEWIPFELLCQHLTSSHFECSRLYNLIDKSFTVEINDMKPQVERTKLIKSYHQINDSKQVILFNYFHLMRHQLSELLDENSNQYFEEFIEWLKNTHPIEYQIYCQNSIYNFCFIQNKNFDKASLNIKRYKLKAQKADRLMLINCSVKMIGYNIDEFKKLLSMINNIEFSLDLIKEYEKKQMPNSIIYSLMDNIKLSLIANLQQNLNEFDEKQISYFNSLIYYAIDTKHFDDVDYLKDYIKINSDNIDTKINAIQHKIQVIVEFWDIYIKILFNQVTDDLLAQLEKLVVKALKESNTLVIGYILKLMLANIALTNNKAQIAKNLYLSTMKLEPIVENERDKVLFILKEKAKENFEKNYDQIA